MRRRCEGTLFFIFSASLYFGLNLNFILETNLQHLRVVVCLRWVQIIKRCTFTGRVGIWEKQRWQRTSCQYQGTNPIRLCHMRQENLWGLSCAFPFSHSLRSDGQYLFLKEKTEKPQSFSLSDIMPVKHTASFNKNGFGKHSDLINICFTVWLSCKADQAILGKKMENGS